MSNEGAGNAASSGPIPDPFAAAKANLRDTVKWLVTTFATMAAAVLAGTTLTGITGLAGWRLAVALTGGAAGLVAVFIATGKALRLLTAESFYFGQIGTDPEIRDKLNKHAADILPPVFSTLDEFLQIRQKAIEVIRSTKDAPESPEHMAAQAFFESLEPSVSRLVNLAHFELLRRNLKRSEGPLFLLAIIALVGLGVFAVFTGAAKQHEAGVIISAPARIVAAPAAPPDK